MRRHALGRVWPDGEVHARVRVQMGLQSSAEQIVEQRRANVGLRPVRPRRGAVVPPSILIEWEKFNTAGSDGDGGSDVGIDDVGINTCVWELISKTRSSNGRRV